MQLAAVAKTQYRSNKYEEQSEKRKQTVAWMRNNSGTAALAVIFKPETAAGVEKRVARS